MPVQNLTAKLDCHDRDVDCVTDFNVSENNTDLSWTGLGIVGLTFEADSFDYLSKQPSQRNQSQEEIQRFFFGGSCW